MGVSENGVYPQNGRLMRKDEKPCDFLILYPIFKQPHIFNASIAVYEGTLDMVTKTTEIPKMARTSNDILRIET